MEIISLQRLKWIPEYPVIDSRVKLIQDLHNFLCVWVDLSRENQLKRLVEILIFFAILLLVSQTFYFLEFLDSINTNLAFFSFQDSLFSSVLQPAPLLNSQQPKDAKVEWKPQKVKSLKVIKLLLPKL